jgi:hypothetical protein
LKLERQEGAELRFHGEEGPVARIAPRKYAILDAGQVPIHATKLAKRYSTHRITVLAFGFGSVVITS